MLLAAVTWIVSAGSRWNVLFNSASVKNSKLQNYLTIIFLIVSIILKFIWLKKLRVLLIFHLLPFIFLHCVFFRSKYKTCLYPEKPWIEKKTVKKVSRNKDDIFIMNIVFSSKYHRFWKNGHSIIVLFQKKNCSVRKNQKSCLQSWRH